MTLNQFSVNWMKERKIIVKATHLLVIPFPLLLVSALRAAQSKDRQRPNEPLTHRGGWPPANGIDRTSLVRSVIVVTMPVALMLGAQLVAIVSHLLEQLHDVGRVVLSDELFVEIEHRHHDAFRIAPIRIAAELNVEGGVARVHAAYSLLVGNRTVAGNDDVDIHFKNAVAGPHPV